MANNVSLLELEQNAQIGMYFLASNDFVLTGKKNLKEEQKKAIEDVLKVPLIEISAYNSEIVGVFLQIDRYENKIYAPNDLRNVEISKLKEICEEYSYSLELIESVENTLGNLISFTNKAVFVSQDIKKTKKQLEKISEKKVIILNDEDFHQAGALVYSVKGQTIASSEFKDSELEKIEDYVDNISTINNGTAYVSSGIVANDKGILIGAQSSTVEIQTILETLEFI